MQVTKELSIERRRAGCLILPLSTPRGQLARQHAVQSASQASEMFLGHASRAQEQDETKETMYETSMPLFKKDRTRPRQAGAHPRRLQHLLSKVRTSACNSNIGLCVCLSKRKIRGASPASFQWRSHTSSHFFRWQKAAGTCFWSCHASKGNAHFLS